MQLALIIFDTAGLIVLAVTLAQLLDRLSRERRARARLETMTCAECRSQVQIGDYLQHGRWHNRVSMVTMYGRHIVTPTQHLDD